MTIVRDAQSVMLPSERRYIENVIRLLCRGGIEEEDEVLLTLIEKDDKYIRDIKGKKAEEHMENIYAEYVLPSFERAGTSFSLGSFKANINISSIHQILNI